MRWRSQISSTGSKGGLQRVSITTARSQGGIRDRTGGLSFSVPWTKRVGRGCLPTDKVLGERWPAGIKAHCGEPGVSFSVIQLALCVYASLIWCCMSFVAKSTIVLIRLRRCAFRLPLPTILPANIQSMDNKLCELRVRISYQWEITLLLFYNYYFVFIQPLSVFLLTIKRVPIHIASIPIYIYPTITKSISKYI